VSSKHQVTLPVRELRSAGFKPGDSVRVEAEGSGRIVLTKVDELLDRYSGSIDSKGKLGEQVAGLRDEWR